jgi:TBC1 domain family member 14
MRHGCNSTRASPLCRDISSPTLDLNQLYTKFDPVSLSESPVERTSHVEDHNDVQNGREVTNDGKGQQHTPNSSDSEAQHRATYSEESHHEPAAPDASQESPSPSPPPPQLPPDTWSGDGSETHPGQTARERSTSTPSLPSSRPSAASSLPRPPPSGHKSSQSTGPSMLERVVNKTRPSFLPPKSKDEDNKHLADWEKMMKRSRAAGTL